jgi:signal transduction histidine kinase
VHHPFESKSESLYQEYIENEARKACVTLTGLAAAIVPSLVFMDYFAYPEQFEILSIIRFSTAALFAFIYYLFRKNLFLNNPVFSGGLCVLIAAASITLMCMALEGSSSPYYAGVFLIAMGCVVILPARVSQMAIIMGLIVLIYVVGIFVAEDFHIKSPSHFITNVHVLMCTGVIGVTAAFFADRMRRESFIRYLEISRSAELLRNELQGGRGSIEELAHSIVVRKTEVQDALDLRNNFISIASHELKTPLTSLRLQMDIGRQKLNTKTLDLGYCEKIINTFDVQLNRILKIVDEMLDVSRIESNRFELKRIETDLSELVKNVLELHFSQFDQLTFESRGEIRGHWDSYRIEQVVINLISNAIRYGEGKPIHIVVNRHGDESLIEVRDLGKGIESHEQERIFDKFERGNASKNYGGLGLGLFISKQIVEAHGGRIDVQSEPGKGSQFRVRLV